jgi:hypothetical protein
MVIIGTSLVALLLRLCRYKGQLAGARCSRANELT